MKLKIAPHYVMVHVNKEPAILWLTHMLVVIYWDVVVEEKKNHDLCGTATIECDVVLSKWGRESEIFFSKQQSARHYVCNKRNNLQMQSEHLWATWASFFEVIELHCNMIIIRIKLMLPHFLPFLLFSHLIVPRNACDLSK